jgi:ribosomal-protein-alanine N-acetyltransferase
MAKFGPEEFQLKDGRKVTLRHCSPDDAELFPVFQRKVAEESTNTLQIAGKAPPIDKVRENWLMCQEDKRHLRLGTFDGGRLIGQLGLRPIQNDHPWVNHVGGFGMMVLEEYWGQGLGKKLLQVMESFARDCGYTRIEAMVRTQNKRGIKLYTNSGYTLEGTRYNAALINGEYEDEYYIGKVLSEKSSHSSWKPPQLETARLLLRPLNQSDADAIFEYAKDPDVCRYTLWEPHEDVTDSMNFIVEYAHSLYRNNTPEPLGICFKDKPETVIGTVGCFWVSKASKSMELAYAIAKPFWGQGLVAESSRVILNYCFDSFDVCRIQARCKAENSGSSRVMEKLGMEFEGTLKSAIYHRGRFWDMHYYSILKDQWTYDV